MKEDYKMKISIIKLPSGFYAVMECEKILAR